MSDSRAIEETIFWGARQWSRPEERAAYLEQACAGDGALRVRVERMLQAEERADDFMARNPLLFIGGGGAPRADAGARDVTPRPSKSARSSALTNCFSKSAKGGVASSSWRNRNNPSAAAWP